MAPQNITDTLPLANFGNIREGDPASLGFRETRTLPKCSPAVTMTSSVQQPSFQFLPSFSYAHSPLLPLLHSDTKGLAIGMQPWMLLSFAIFCTDDALMLPTWSATV